METGERKNDEKKAPEGWAGPCWCGSDAEAGEAGGCCGGTWTAGDGSSMMGRCATVCRWFPLLPLALGIALLLLGYYLDASVTRVLWMLGAGFVTLMGALGLILAGRMCAAMR
ncbi:MAG: hypothetical protein ACYTAS_10520 [Planctomycetota bacterium]